MLFRQFFDNTSSTYTYLIASGRGREALIIDPVKEYTEAYLGIINQLDLRLVRAIDTHTHADHFTALGDLRDEPTASPPWVNLPTRTAYRSRYPKGTG